ncbi:MAG: PilZ domain-containing protein [Planctomycetes bacterium]|nr:PilZ domain-containing protein [Planctomycetota bacterium]
MYERRESYRFRIPPGGDQAMVTVDGATFVARLLDTSAGGLSLRIEEPVQCKIGQKVEVELGEHDFNLTRVVRVENDEGATVLGLMRLKDQRWDEIDDRPGVPIRKILKRERRDWLPGPQAPIGVLLLIVGMAIGFMVWRPQHAPDLPKDKSSNMAPPQLAPAEPAKPRASKPVPQRTPAPQPAPATVPKTAKTPASAPSTVPAAESPQWPVSIAPVSPKAASAGDSPKSAQGDFQRILARLPRSVQFQFRQLESLARSPGPRGAWLQTQQEVQRIVERLEAQLASVFEQSGSDEPALNKVSQPLIDDARRKIDKLHGNSPPQRETGAGS